MSVLSRWEGEEGQKSEVREEGGSQRAPGQAVLCSTPPSGVYAVTQKCSGWATVLVNHPLMLLSNSSSSNYKHTNNQSIYKHRCPNILIETESRDKMWFPSLHTLLIQKVAAHCPSSFSLANTEWLWNIPYGPLQHSNYVPFRCCKELVLSDEGSWCI